MKKAGVADINDEAEIADKISLYLCLHGIGDHDEVNDIGILCESILDSLK